MLIKGYNTKMGFNIKKEGLLNEMAKVIYWDYTCIIGVIIFMSVFFT